MSSPNLEELPSPEERGGRGYPNPPIEEALCQVSFAEPLSWSVATPGLLFEVLRDRYPEEPEAQEQVAASLQLVEEAQAANIAFNRGPLRYVYKDKTRTRLVVVSPTSCSVNSLRPYEGWPALRQRLAEALRDLWELTGVQPVAQVSLRYINRIVLPPGRADTDDYFNLVVRTAEEGRADFNGFMHRVESALTDGATLAASTFASMQPEPSGTPFLLDLEFRRPNLALDELEDILDVADDLKGKENREFESSIKDPARSLFR